MDDQKIQQKLKEGWILARIIIEVAGKPKKYVEDTLKNYLKTIESDKAQIIKKDLNKAKKQEEDIYAAFAELEIIFKSLNDLVYFCFDYMPSSVEIYDPQEFVYKARDLNAFLNDLQAKLHDANIAAKQISQQNMKLNENFTKLMKNFVAVACSGGKTLKQLEATIGVPQIHIEKVLGILIKEQRVKKEGEVYRTVK